jgi:hypothetical protein
VSRTALNIKRDGLEAQFPHREVWWLPETDLGGGIRITWHSKVRGALNADVHGGSAAELAEHIELADADREESR